MNDNKAVILKLRKQIKHLQAAIEQLEMASSLSDQEEPSSPKKQVNSVRSAAMKEAWKKRRQEGEL